MPVVDHLTETVRIFASNATVQADSNVVPTATSLLTDSARMNIHRGAVQAADMALAIGHVADLAAIAYAPVSVAPYLRNGNLIEDEAGDIWQVDGQVSVRSRFPATAHCRVLLQLQKSRPRSIPYRETVGAAGGGIGSCPPLPTWPTTYPYPERLRDLFYAIADSAVDPLTLSRAQHDFGPAKIAKWAALTPKPSIELRWETSALWPTPGSAAMDPDVYAGIKYILQGYLQAGMGAYLSPQDNLNLVYTDLHGDAGYDWDWLSASWIALIQQLETDLGPDGFGPQSVVIEPVNEMGNGVDQALWSMATYNAMWAAVIPALRAGLPFYSFHIDTYPLAAPNHYGEFDWGTSDGTLLALPEDSNLVVCVHPFGPGPFTFQGIGGTSPSSQRWIAGMEWGWSKAEALAYLATYDAFGQVGTGNADLDAQVAWWQANGASQIGALGFTKAAIEDGMAGLIAYCQTNRRALSALQWSALGYGSATFAMPEAQANAYEADMSSVFYENGIPSGYWLEQMLTDDPLRADQSNVGSESFLLSRVEANVARIPPP